MGYCGGASFLFYLAATGSWAVVGCAPPRLVSVDVRWIPGGVPG